MQQPVFADNTTIIGDGTEDHPLVAAAAPASPGGAPNDVQFNDAGAFGGNSAFTFTKATLSLSFNSSNPGTSCLFKAEGVNSRVAFVSGTTGNVEFDLCDTTPDTFTIITVNHPPGILLLIPAHRDRKFC